MDMDFIRKEIINKRKELSFEYKLEASKIISKKLYELEEYKKANNLLVYADASGEVLTDEIILNSMIKGKNVYAPVCGDNYSMDFYRIYSLEELTVGHYGIREPLAIEKEKLTESVIDDGIIAIVPGVVFDRKNNRMGYGRGYYDRFFAKMNIPYRIGLAYDFQIVDEIITKDTDIAMTRVIDNII